MGNYLQLFRPYLIKTVITPAVLAVVLFIAGMLYVRKSLPYRDHGIEKQAVVKEIIPRPGQGAELNYYYWDEASKSHEFRTQVPSQWKLYADNNRSVPVTYLPESPNDHMVGGVRDVERAAAPGEWMKIAAILLMLTAAGFLAALLIKIRRILEVIRNGTPLSTVVAEWVKASQHQLKPDRIKYHFSGPDGRWYEGFSISLPQKLIRKFPVGSRMMIYFDPNHPGFHQVDVFGMGRKKVKADKEDQSKTT